MLKMTEVDWSAFDRAFHSHELRSDRVEEGPPSEMVVGLSSDFGTHWPDEGVSCRIRCARLDLVISGENRPHASWQLGRGAITEVKDATFTAVGTETRPSWDIEICGDERAALEGAYTTDGNGLMRLRDYCAKTQVKSELLINLRTGKALSFSGTEGLGGNKKFIVENMAQSPLGKIDKKHGWMLLSQSFFKISGDDE